MVDTERTLNDAVKAFDWAFGLIMKEPMPARQEFLEAGQDKSNALWRCSVCREMVSKEAIEFRNGLPVCWACIDEKIG